RHDLLRHPFRRAEGPEGHRGLSRRSGGGSSVMALLEISDLDVHYGAIHALRGVNITVEERQIVTLIGANGAGKSTTLRAISGMVRPSGGRIVFNGEDLTGRKPHDIVRRGISQAPEGRGIFANLTVADNLEIGAYQRHDRAGIARDRANALELF